jgi:hypothetical protein
MGEVNFGRRQVNREQDARDQNQANLKHNRSACTKHSHEMADGGILKLPHEIPKPCSTPPSSLAQIPRAAECEKSQPELCGFFSRMI